MSSSMTRILFTMREEKRREEKEKRRREEKRREEKEREILIKENFLFNTN